MSSWNVSLPFFSLRATRWALAALTLSAGACSSTGKHLADSNGDPFLADESAEELTVVADESPAGRSRVALSNTGIRQARYEEPAGRERPYLAIQQVAAEARLPVGPECRPVIEESPEALARDFPDEYLFDGGDRELPVHYNDFQMQGLDSEDTVIEFHDDVGNRKVLPSNRVAIYAPRFGAVTSVSATLEDVGGGSPNQAVSTQQQSGMRNRELLIAQNQNEMAERLITRSRGSNVVNLDSAQSLAQPITIQGNVQTLVPIEEFGFVRTGQFQQADEARLAVSLQVAESWTRDQNPVIVAIGDGATELRSLFNVSELVGRENRFGGKGKLRIVKLADRKIASPGDVITFTVRFDNIGDREVRDVVISDNLTPRLEYVNDSATCDRDGRLVTEDNGEGSLILRWELDDPLAGRTGGVVTFQARVR